MKYWHGNVENWVGVTVRCLGTWIVAPREAWSLDCHVTGAGWDLVQRREGEERKERGGYDCLCSRVQRGPFRYY